MNQPNFAAAKPFRRRRSAITLIEVLGTLSVLLVLAVSAASILGSITEIGLRTGRDKQGRIAIERLAKLFRKDVRQTESVTASDATWPIKLSHSDTNIRYDFDDTRKSIRRTVSKSEKQLEVDEFRLPERCSPRLSIGDDLVALHLTGEQDLQTWTIEAVRK